MILLKGALSAMVVLTLVACARPFGAAPPASRCGPPSPIDPRFHLAVAGPLVFYGGLGTTHAIVGDFAPGIPAKVGISATPPLTSAVTLQGWDCASGTRLRFWYRPGSNLFDAVPVTAAQLGAAGDLTAVLPPDDRGVYPGYILFTHAGNWMVEARQGGRLLGSVVFDVLDPNDKGSG